MTAACHGRGRSPGRRLGRPRCRTTTRRKPSAFPVRARAAHIRRRVRGRLGLDGNPPRRARSGRRRFRRSAGVVAPARRRVERVVVLPRARPTQPGVAWRLRALGLASGERMLTWSPSTPALPAVYFGAMRAGARPRTARSPDVARRDRTDRRQGGGDAPGARQRTRRAGPARGAAWSTSRPRRSRTSRPSRRPTGRPTGPTRSPRGRDRSRPTCSRSSSRAGRRARRRA